LRTSWAKIKQKRADAKTEVVEHLPSKHRSSNASTTIKKRRGKTKILHIVELSYLVNNINKIPQARV
jgi:hypothetical protein